MEVTTNLSGDRLSIVSENNGKVSRPGCLRLYVSVDFVNFVDRKEQREENVRMHGR
jgi:hypothetical protein